MSDVSDFPFSTSAGGPVNVECDAASSSLPDDGRVANSPPQRGALSSSAQDCETSRRSLYFVAGARRRRSRTALRARRTRRRLGPLRAPAVDSPGENI
jgi:hypothetical protein